MHERYETYDENAPNESEKMDLTSFFLDCTIYLHLNVRAGLGYTPLEVLRSSHQV